jgi:hypothetical protein
MRAVVNALKSLALTAIFPLWAVIHVKRRSLIAAHDIEHFLPINATAVSYGRAVDRWLLQRAALVLDFVAPEGLRVLVITQHARLKNWLSDGATLCAELPLGRWSRR